MRLKEGADFLDGRQPAIDQFQENPIHNLAVSSQLGGNAHLLHQSVGDALAGLGPHFKKQVKAFLHGRICARKPKP